jgi:hypothetical protein
VTSITSGTGGTPTTLHSNTTPTTPQDTTPTTTAARPASQVRVLVANGAGVANLGARIRGQLNQAGYNTTKPAVDAPTQNNATSSVYFQAGFEADAIQLATAVLDLPQTAVQPLSQTAPPVPATDLVNVDVLIVAGQDIGGGSTQTTSAPGATVAPGTTTPRSTTTVKHTSPSTTHAPTPTTRAPSPTTAPPPSHTTTTVNLK